MTHITKKHVLATLGAAVSLGVLVFGVRYWWMHRPLGLPQTAEQAVAGVASDRFKNMPEYRQQEYLEQTRRLMDELPREERRALVESVPEFREVVGEARMREMEQRMKDYMLADAATRAQMDQEAEQRMAQWRQNRPAGQGGPGGPRPDGDRQPSGEWQSRMRERMEQRFEEGNPQLNGWRSEFFRHRREQQEKKQQQPNLHDAA